MGETKRVPDRRLCSRQAAIHGCTLSVAYSPDRGDDRESRHDDVCRVHNPSQTRLDHNLQNPEDVQQADKSSDAYILFEHIEGRILRFRRTNVGSETEAQITLVCDIIYVTCG